MTGAARGRELRPDGGYPQRYCIPGRRRGRAVPDMLVCPNHEGVAMPQFQRPPTTQQVVLDALRRAIQDGELLPGSTIRPDDIAARFGVSRIPVRESLKILEGQGLVEHSAHARYVVPMLTAEDAVEIYAIRARSEERRVG